MFMSFCLQRNMFCLYLYFISFIDQIVLCTNNLKRTARFKLAGPNKITSSIIPCLAKTHMYLSPNYSLKDAWRPASGGMAD